MGFCPSLRGHGPAGVSPCDRGARCRAPAGGGGVIALVFLVCLAAWVLLGLGLPRHARQMFGRALPPGLARSVRFLGWLGLPLGLILAIAAEGASFGSVYWAASLMLAAMAWVLVLAWRDRGRR
ncbi:DUF3325 domain-containing protein [Arenimonas fontis]|uniref:DUF3325 domain-containing protein n=1 Tax=Arenimonas fontis TaxID=2608255 RepID=A0A5B2ZAR4_9GAMM|nr:DUF3325 domain-containing protein [Arenimonas fontis]